MDKQRFTEDGFQGFVADLVASNKIEEKELGIAKQMLDKGYKSLSEKQKYVFDRMINKHTVNECQRCGIDIPWSEMFAALDKGGLCNYCQHLKEKMDAE